MGYRYKNDTKNPIIYEMNIKRLSKQDLCRTLSCSLNTLQTYIQRPNIMRFEDIILLSGLFGLPVEELTYKLIRNKNMLHREGKWFLEDIRERNK